MIYRNGTVSEALVFWGAMDPRNPKYISSLKTFLGDQIEDDSEMSLELLTRLDQKRTMNKTRNPKSEDQDEATSSYLGPDILSDYSERAVELVSNVIDLRDLEKCSQVLACRLQTLLTAAGLQGLISSRSCSSSDTEQQENNICN